MASGEVPLTSGFCIAVGTAVALTLNVTAKGDGQVVVVPCLVPGGEDATHVLHAFINGRGGGDILLCLLIQGLRLSLRVREGIATADGKAVGQEEFHRSSDAAQGGAVDIVALTNSGPTLVLQSGEGGAGVDFGLGHCAVVDHIADFVQESADADHHP